MGACKELMQGNVVDCGHRKSELDQMRCRLIFQGGNGQLIWSSFQQKGMGAHLLYKGVFVTELLRSQREPECNIMCLSTLGQWGFGATTDKAEVVHWKEEGLR